jgi:hypothetical protein
MVKVTLDVGVACEAEAARTRARKERRIGLMRRNFPEPQDEANEFLLVPVAAQRPYQGEEQEHVG